MPIRSRRLIEPRLPHRNIKPKTASIKSKELWIPLISMIVSAIVGLSAVISGAIMQKRINDSQLEMKKFELFDKPKREGYASFMRALAMTHESAYLNRNPDDLASKMNAIED